jgi:hypothetical protein
MGKNRLFKKLRKIARESGKKEALDYVKEALEGKNLFGRIQFAWRIVRCTI